jgi:hypothetical protein
MSTDQFDLVKTQTVARIHAQINATKMRNRVAAIENAFRQREALMNSVHYAPKTYMTSGSAVSTLREVHTGTFAVAASTTHTPAPNAIQWVEPRAPVKLNLKTSPLFGFLRYRFDSPLAPVGKWFIKFIWSMRKALN